MNTADSQETTQVLVVEDEAVLRLTFAQFLKNKGYAAVTAADYGEAMECIRQQTFDVIVTDILLPGKNGVDLLRTIREEGMRCPVIMITGEPNVETAAEAVRLGAFDYISKPVKGDTLTRTVRLALESKRLGEERDAYAARASQYHRELNAIFNSVRDGLITVDADMRIRQVNQAGMEILGIEEGVEGQPFQEFLPGELQPAQQALEKTLRTHEPVQDTRVEFCLRRKGERVVMVNTAPLVGEHNTFTGAVLTLRDVTRLVRLEQQLEESQQYRDMIGKSAKMREIFTLIEELADTDSTVLICGESGTGKELVAAAIHHASGRARGPFVRVNCAALSENILESELFGHVKGAFTGAVRDRAGRFEAAHKGTLLLDEIGDISPRLQLRLLRVLQEGEFERVGDSSPVKSDVRILASTNRSLEEKIHEGEFRQDLYYRLNVIRLELPPLRERREDIPLLVDHFCRRFNRAFKKEITGVAPETMSVFMDYSWPGNIRELENCMERAFIICHEPAILPRHLPPEIVGGGHTSRADVSFHVSHRDDGGTSRQQILNVLEQTDWNIAKSARLLGVARNTLYQRMRNLRISRPRQ